MSLTHPVTNPVIRPATRADLPALVQIEQESFARPHWTAKDFLQDSCTVAEIDGQVVGLLVSRELFAGDSVSPPEREILNLAVAREFRRLGIATALLRHELSGDGDKRERSYFLEVRESNVGAQELYRRFGFSEIARRPNYYRFPEERAIVMHMKWC